MADQESMNPIVSQEEQATQETEYLKIIAQQSRELYYAREVAADALVLLETLGNWTARSLFGEENKFYPQNGVIHRLQTFAMPVIEARNKAMAEARAAAAENQE